jgi:cytochrome bd ubiquinol oxidase subunit I
VLVARGRSNELKSFRSRFWSRFQFGFTLTYHYLFPQLTMGLAWFLVYWKWRALKTGDEKYNNAVRFWAKIFGLNFAVGVVTGIPMEFQFGTNWAGFSRYAGGVIGQTLAMEGMFAFFLESAFVGALIWGEKRLGPRHHFLCGGSCPGKLAFWLFHFGHQCFYAASRGIQG